MPSSAIALIDMLLSFGSITLFALGTALAIRDTDGILQGRILIAFLASLTFLALAIAPGAHLLPAPLLTISTAIGVPNLGLLWWFCLSLLRDDFRIGGVEWVGLVALGFAPCFYLVESFGYSLPFSTTVHSLGSIVPLLMVGHVIWVALSERNSDLVEHRRRARLWIVFAPFAALLVSLLSEPMQNGHLSSILRNGLGVIPTQLVLLFWLARMSPEQLQFKALARVPFKEPLIDLKDMALHRRLTQAIEEQQVYLRPGLTIENLAELLKTPTH